MGSSWTPTFSMTNNLRLSPLTISSLECGRRTRVYSLELNLMSTHSHWPSIANQLGDPPFGRFHRHLALSFSIIIFGSLGLSTLWVWLEHRLKQNLKGPSYAMHSIQNLESYRDDKKRALSCGTKGEDKTFLRFVEWVQRISNLYFFILSAAFVPFFLGSIKCALKDSSCDSPIPKNLMLTILASNASSSSTKVFKYPHTRNDSLFTQWFILTQDEEGLFKPCNWVECKDCAAEDPLMTLVEIVDELGDPSFNQLIAFSVLPSTSSYSGSSVLLRGTNKRLTDSSFLHLSIHALLGIGPRFHETIDDAIPIDEQRLCTTSNMEFDSDEEVDPAQAGDEVEVGDAMED
ncbi:hypothetical protein H5410_003082 [Solanum commersonii]|uniref:Uncharacterized protein n=1 Tax=Solanum commersonii TaxID=4109 RepID=A0A9J6B3N9_SOLCO|nr:hypothetical protein H5410_003082 [Solanum commersonii]